MECAVETAHEREGSHLNIASLASCKPRNGSLKAKAAKSKLLLTLPSSFAEWVRHIRDAAEAFERPLSSLDVHISGGADRGVDVHLDHEASVAGGLEVHVDQEGIDIHVGGGEEGGGVDVHLETKEEGLSKGFEPYKNANLQELAAKVAEVSLRQSEQSRKLDDMAKDIRSILDVFQSGLTDTRARADAPQAMVAGSDHGQAGASERELSAESPGQSPHGIVISTPHVSVYDPRQGNSRHSLRGESVLQGGMEVARSGSDGHEMSDASMVTFSAASLTHQQQAGMLDTAVPMVIANTPNRPMNGGRHQPAFHRQETANGCTPQALSGQTHKGTHNGNNGSRTIVVTRLDSPQGDGAVSSPLHVAREVEVRSGGGGGFVGSDRKFDRQAI